jgi:hypothetical protein
MEGENAMGNNQKVIITKHMSEPNNEEYGTGIWTWIKWPMGPGNSFYFFVC